MKDTFQIVITAQQEAAVIALGEIIKYDSRAFSSKLSSETQLVTVPNGYFALLKELQNTIFIRHIFPVQIVTPVDIYDLDQQLIDLCGNLPKVEAFSIQMRCYSSSVVRDRMLSLIKAIEQGLLLRGYICNDKQPVWVLSLYIHENEMYAGVSSCVDNLSDWNGGMHRFKKYESFISRAEFKLQEAISAFGIDMKDIVSSNNKCAVDLGAAPGGWTKILLDYGLHVTAVDPALLSENIINHPNLIHIRDVAQNFIGKKDDFAILTNDMRMDMIESCKIMLDMALFLSPGSIALITLKLPHNQWYKKTKRALSILKNKYIIQNVRQLFHNRSEVTVYLKKLD